MVGFEPGDIIFYKSNEDWKGQVIGLLERAFHETGAVTGPGYCHVAMVAGDPRLVVEMTEPKSRLRVWTMDVRPKTVIRLRCPDEFKQKAIDWAYAHVGEEYSVVQYALTHWGVDDSTQFCSLFICGNKGAYEAGAGFQLISPPRKMVSPDEAEQAARALGDVVFDS